MLNRRATVAWRIRQQKLHLDPYKETPYVKYIFLKNYKFLVSYSERKTKDSSFL